MVRLSFFATRAREPSTVDMALNMILLKAVIGRIGLEFAQLEKRCKKW